MLPVGDVAGCAIYYSPFNEVFGIPYSFECTVGSGRAGDSYSDILDYARIGAEALSSLLNLKVSIEDLSGWEYIGRMFNVFMYSINARGRREQLRVVELGGRILGIFGVLEKIQGLQPPKDYSEPVKAVGSTPRIVLLKPVESGEETPSGQKVVSRSPIYAVEGVIRDARSWILRVEGRVRRELRLTLEDLLKLAQDKSEDPFHCVTGWTLKGRVWEGVRLSTLLEEAGVLEDAKWLIAVSRGGYAAVSPLEEALKGLLVLRVDGRPLREEEGYPLRLFIPQLYGWKHTKWLERIVVSDSYMDGYWEALAYHERGRVDSLERFKVRNLEIIDEGYVRPGGRMIKPPGL